MYILTTVFFANRLKGWNCFPIYKEDTLDLEVVPASRTLKQYHAVKNQISPTSWLK